MKFILLFTLTLGWLTAPEVARADWVVFGAAAKCDSAQGVFSLVPVVRTSSDEHNLVPPEDFTEFKERENQHFNCILGKTAIRLTISVWAPSSSGEGQGAGVIEIVSFNVAGRNVLHPGTNFLWQAQGERVLTKIVVQSSKNGIDPTYCYSNGFDWDEPTSINDMKCQKAVEGSSSI
jgi:hypothetical protein